MSDHSNPGEVVFNARWEYFPELFFWNSKNVYTSGMDPIFQYTYDPRRYWLGYSLVTGKKALLDYTPQKCDEAAMTDPYRVLKDDFNARFLFLAKPFDNRLYVELLTDRRFLLKQESANYAIFELN